VLRVFGSGDERRLHLSVVDGHVAGDRFSLIFDRPAGPSIGGGFAAHRCLSQAVFPQGAGFPAVRVTFGRGDKVELATYSGTAWVEEMAAFVACSLEGSSLQQYELRGDTLHPTDALTSNGGLIDIMCSDQPFGYVPRAYSVEDVVRHVAWWLDRVTDRLSVMRERRVEVASLALEAPQPLETPFGAHLLVGKAVATRLSRPQSPWRRWVAWPSKPVLLASDVYTPGYSESVLPAAWRPMAWAVAEEPDRADPRWLPLFRFGLREAPALVRVSVTVSNDAWVADLAAVDDRKAASWAERAVLADIDMSEARVALARSMVPLAAYQGNHRRPLLLLARELRSDEVVEVVA
jgi:hypothetical protein